MSGSWNQSGRNLIDDIKETLRQYFQGAQAYDVSLDLPVAEVCYWVPISSEAYGGILLSQTLPCAPIPLEFTAEQHGLETAILCSLQGGMGTIDTPQVGVMPLLIQQAKLHQPTLIANTVQTKFIQPQAKLDMNIQGYSRAQLRMKPEKRASAIHPSRFKQPLARSLSKLQSRTYKLAPTKTLIPIQRKPIPMHRFSQKNRTMFRELLAQKAKLPVLDVQLIGIYDRIFPGLYQSISQTEDGTLLCIPKLRVEDREEQPLRYPVYLILGKSSKAPGQSLQAVIPMKDLSND